MLSKYYVNRSIFPNRSDAKLSCNMRNKPIKEFNVKIEFLRQLACLFQYCSGIILGYCELIAFGKEVITLNMSLLARSKPVHT